jgi:16S rRNA C967 or C1407 C5-methylase (RsmB/RsmF family)
VQRDRRRDPAPPTSKLRTPADVDRAAALQGQLLGTLWKLLKPGGQMVYATCTILAQENNEQVMTHLRNTESPELGGRAAVSRVVFARRSRGGEYGRLLLCLSQ